MKKGNLQAAVSLLQEASCTSRDLDEEVMCLFVPKKIESKIEFVELKEHPQLHSEIAAALETLAEEHSDNPADSTN
jgi:hypothetical protein